MGYGSSNSDLKNSYNLPGIFSLKGGSSHLDHVSQIKKEYDIEK